MTAELTRLELDLGQGQVISDRPTEVLGFAIDTILLRLLREYFKSGPYLIPALSKVYYKDSISPDVREELKHIMEIELLHTYRGDQLNQGPKILIRADAVANIPTGIGGGARMSPTTINREGGTLYENWWAGSVVLFCMSTQPAESRLLAFETAYLLRHYQQELRQELCNCKKLQVTQVGATGKTKEYPDFFGTPVPIDYAYTDNVSIWPKSLPIREIVLNVNPR